ncbi:hypothetical protein L1887_16834 [Cichorium endivia]|nr:hypothetical protein L1887_16834 [Cichorium endivia]
MVVGSSTMRHIVVHVWTKECCNSCEDVREAYRKKGWAMSDPDMIMIDQVIEDDYKVVLDVILNELRQIVKMIFLAFSP